MAEELLEIVDRFQSRLQENLSLKETTEQVETDGLVRHRPFPKRGSLSRGRTKLRLRQPNSHAKRSLPHTHSGGPEAGGEELQTIRGVLLCGRAPLRGRGEEEERGYHTNYSPSPPRQEQYSPPQRGGYQSDEYGSPEPEPEPEPELCPPPPPPRKEVRHAKPNKEPSKNHHHHGDRNRDREEERRQRHTQTSSDRGGGGGEGKKRGADRERQQSPLQKPAKHSKKSTTHESKREEKKKGGDDGRPRAPKDSPSKEEDEEFEAPTMSFESFLTYDAPTSVKKKKKPSSSSSSSHSRPSHSSSSTSSSHHHTRTPAPPSSSSSSKVSKANGTQSTKRPHSSSSSAAAPAPEKRKRVVEAVPTLPEIPLPAIQPNYRPLPSIDVTPLSPQRRKVPIYNDEEDAGFTGKRFNSKMVVYSGSKTSYLPKMMTLYEQCIRVLQNNIDSIAEVGGVPFDILEPVLERCTPEQLYRIEQNNQCFTEDSDELWMRHCQRDFKRETPQEYESWREMYLRLHDEREERLRMLTQNITSAHANKPKGRQVKMAYVNSVAKPPRDVRRRQEKFGTTSGLSTAASNAAAAPIKIRPATTDYSGESSHSSSSQHNPSSSLSRSSAPGGGGGVGGGGGGVGVGGGHAARDKPQVKKIAPMMAKTIKAFKNRFSRR
ncbi:transcription elongation factor B polypeptide 3 [Lates japonicus]|uniref:Transcription elongation factor B polypeptide 3 n=1 Tax=Lates japonicus TaxID=270547 RepID=A0AAD3MQD5_LATJO|nr:transcription elongation factor B polypeptide 3 [Lates japonicus]